MQTTRLTRYQFKVLVALAKLGGRNVYSSEFMSAAEVPSSGTATKALQRLVADGLVFVHDKEYRFLMNVFDGLRYHEIYDTLAM